MKTFRRTGLLTRTALGSAVLIAAGFSQPARAQTTVAGTISNTASNGGNPTIGTVGNTTTITTGGSRTVLNWNDLDLTPGNVLQYVVAGRGDIVLNRVTDASGALIDGALRSNVGSAGGAVGGNIWFAAPGGVAFGNSAVVNVGGLLATTASITDADFLDDNSFAFVGAPETSAITVFSTAQLNVSGGTLALIAPVVTSAGTIADTSAARHSDVLFGAAEAYTITFAPDSAGDLDLLSWTVANPASAGSNSATPIQILGQVNAGNIYLGAVSRRALADALVSISGTLTASGAAVNGDGNIVLSAGGGISNGASTVPAGSITNAQTDNLTANRDVSLDASGNLQTEGLSAARNVSLVAGGNLTVNSQVVVGGNYAVTADDFMGPGGAFNPNFNGGIANDLTITDTAGGTSIGNLTAPGTLTINAVGGGLTITGPIASTSENIVLTASSAGNGISLQGTVTTATVARSVTLSAGGGVSQTAGGVIATTVLTGSAGGLFDLDDAANNVGGLTNITANGIRFREWSGLSLSGVINAGTGGLSISVDTGGLALNNLDMDAGQDIAWIANSITLNNAQVDASGTGNVTIGGAVQALGNNALSGDAVTFTGAVNGSGSLTVTSDVATHFQSTVGAATALSNLTIGGAGTTTLGGNVTTSAAQTYDQDVVLGAAVTLSSTGAGNIVFNDDINGAYALTVNTSGATIFNGAVGFGGALASLATDADGTTQVNGTWVISDGSLTLNDAVLLGGGAFLRSGAGGAITFGSTVDGSHTLNLTSGSSVHFAGAVGAATPLFQLSSIGGGTVTIDGSITTTGSQGYNGLVSLGSSVTLTGTTSNFAQGIQGNGNNLALNYSGAFALDGATLSGIRNLAVGGGGTTQVRGAITTSGSQTYSDNVFLGDATILTSTSGGDISLNGTVSGGRSLAVNTIGTTLFGGRVGFGSPLVELITDAGGTTVIDATSITTVGAQTFNDAVTLGANTVLTGTTGSFASVNGAGNDLTLDYSGATAISGATFSGIRNLASGGGGTTSIAGTLATTGTQTYADTLSLGGGTVLQSSGLGAAGDIGLSAVTGNGYSFTVATGGDLHLGSAIEGITTLSGSARKIDVDGSISAASVTLSSAAGDINVNQAIDTLVTGAVSLGATGGSIRGTGRITGHNVALRGDNGVGTGTARVNTAAGILAASAGAGASVYVNEADAVALEDVGGVSNGAGARYDIVAGSLNVGGPVGVANGTAALEATSAAGISLAGSVSAGGAGGAIILTSSGHISQGAGALTASTLSGSATNAATLSSASNDIATLGSFSTGSGFAYRDANGFAVSGPVSAAGGGITLTAGSQSLTLAGDVTAPGQTVTLNASSGSVNQTAGIITAGMLAGFISVDANLARPNQIGSIGSLIANSLSLSDLGGLSITGAVQGNLAAGDVDIRTTGGDLIIGSLGSVAGRNVVLSTDAAFVNQSATGAASTGSGGRWVIYAAAPTGNTFGNLDSGNTAIWNGTIDTVAASSLSGNRYVFAYRPTVTFTSVGGSKIYGTVLTGAGAYSVSGLHPGVAGAFLADTAATAFSGTPLVSSAGFAERASVAGGPYAVSIGAGTVAGLNGYGVNFVDSGAITVTPKAVTATVSVDTKTYDRTTSATGSFGLSGALSGDDVAASGVLSFADKNAGANKPVTITGAALTGADAGNYALVLPTGLVGEILQATLHGRVTADGKVYDGTTGATGRIALDGVFAGDDVGASVDLEFAAKDAGTAREVRVTGASLSGGGSGNYLLVVPASVFADIARRALNVTVTADSKTYDGTTNATGTLSAGDAIAGDDIAVTGTLAFADKNAGQGKTVLIDEAALSGGDAGNYTLTLPTSVVADILKKALNGTAAVDSKTYDGSVAASGSISLAGIVAGDQVAAAADFAFADKNAGQGKTVLVGNAALSGADAGNYTLALPANAVADIHRKTIQGTAAADSKTYDGTTNATGAIALAGVIAGDQLSASGSFAFTDKNAGEAKTLTISGVALAGADAGNYALEVPATAVASILKKALSAIATAQSKTYDGSTATQGGVALNGIVQGDNVSASASFAFVDRNAGTAKTVQVTNAALTGADAGNYTVVVPASAVADILQRAITVAAQPAAKIEGSADPEFGYSVVSGSLVSGDSLTGSPVRQPGEGPGAYAIGQGTLAASANYLLTFEGATLTIEPATHANPDPSETLKEDFDGFLRFLDSELSMAAEEPAPLLIGDGQDVKRCGGADEQPCAAAPAS